MHANYYLIDLENVQSRGFMGADLLGADGCIVIFYSCAANTITAADEERILRGQAAVRIRPVRVHTKDALDFELAVYTGG